MRHAKKIKVSSTHILEKSKSKKQAIETVILIRYQIEEGKYFKIPITHMFTVRKTCLKGIKGMMTMLHQTENIIRGF